MTNRAAIPNPALQPLAMLIGDWQTTGNHPAVPMRTAWFKDPDGNIFSLVTPPNAAARETESASAQSTA